jgi:hypothetical protein
MALAAAKLTWGWMNVAGRATPCALKDRRHAAAALQIAFRFNEPIIRMNKPSTSPVPAAKTLTEQKSDFTAEGSPPPGKVSTSLPASSPEPGQASPAGQPERATITLKPAAARARP